jgi:hypothetical protein
MKPSNRYVLGREHNVVHVDFAQEPDPPAPKFPGGAALRRPAQDSRPLYAFAAPVWGGLQPREANAWATSS